MRDRVELAINRIDAFMEDDVYSKEQILKLLTCEHEGFTLGEAMEALDIFTGEDHTND